MARDLRPKWTLDSKHRLVIKDIVMEELGIGKGAHGHMEVYGKDKILLTILDFGVQKEEKEKDGQKK